MMVGVSSSRRIGEILLASGAIDQAQLGAALAEQAGLRFARPPLPTSDPLLLAKLPMDQARALSVLPLSLGPTGLIRVAVADPFDVRAQATVSTALQSPLSLIVCPADELALVIESTYAAAKVGTASVIEALPALEDEEEEELDIIWAGPLVPDVDEDAEERIIEVAVRSLPLGGTLPPGLLTLSPGSSRRPVVHSAPPDDDLDLPATAEETEQSDHIPEPPDEFDLDDDLDLAVIEEGASPQARVIVPNLPAAMRSPLAPPPVRQSPKSPPPPPLANLGPPPAATDTLLSPVRGAPPSPPAAPLDEDTVANDGRDQSGSALPLLPPSLGAKDARLRHPDDSRASLPIQETLDLDAQRNRGLAGVVKDLRSERSPATAAQLLSALLAHGLDRQCDALRLRAEGADLRVDYRVDGAMQFAVRLPAWSRLAAIEAIHQASGLALDAPAADAIGRGFEASWKGRAVRCRVTSVTIGPTSELLLRIRDSGSVRNLNDLGLPANVRKRLRQWGAARQGVILVVGPEDSGRSTTLRAIARAERRRVCVVGPWDLFTTDGQETHRYGEGPGEEDVAEAVHNALARDPDVLVIDGVEDVASLVIRAADDGRLVVAGVTADDAAAAVRILLKGVSESLLGQQLLGIVEQRMGRALCTSCKSTSPVDKGLARRLSLQIDTMPTSLPARGSGCQACRHSGTRGRYALFTRVEAAGDLPSGSSKAAKRLQVYIDGNRPVSAAEEGLGLVVQGKLSLHDLGLALGVGLGRPGADRVVVTAEGWTLGAEETMEAPAPIQSLDEEPTEGSGPHLLPDLLGDDLVSGEFFAASATIESPGGRLLLVIGGDGLDDQLRQFLPSGEFRVASVADIASAQDFIQRTAPRAILLSVGGDIAGSVAQVAVLREDLASAFLPLLAVGAVGDDAHALVRAGVDETLAGDLTGPQLESQVREAMLRAT
jgi:general secretion pathway protein E